MTADTPPIPVGTVLEVPEQHYLYGTGRLRLRVSEVVGVERHGGERWVRILGVGLCWNGVEDGPREVVVRLSALAGAVRRGGPSD